MVKTLTDALDGSLPERHYRLRRMDFDLCEPLAKIFETSLRSRQGLGNVHTYETQVAHLSMKLSSSEDDMLSCLLLESLHARICLAEELEAANELRHIRRVLRLQGHTDYGRRLRRNDQFPTYRATTRRSLT